MIEPIVVIGPGRCGTSCVAGVLHHLGVFMGSRFVDADPTNPHGHWEDWAFVQLNAAILNRGITPGEWARRVEHLIASRCALGVPWGWKDPRTCNLLADYLRLFNDSKFIRCVRAPVDIEASVVNAYGDRGWMPGHACALRTSRERELDQYMPWYQTLEIDFDRLRRDRELTVRAIVEFCGLGGVSQDRLRSAIEFIRPKVA